MYIKSKVKQLKKCIIIIHHRIYSNIKLPPQWKQNQMKFMMNIMSDDKEFSKYVLTMGDKSPKNKNKSEYNIPFISPKETTKGVRPQTCTSTISTFEGISYPMLKTTQPNNRTDSGKNNIS